MAPEKTSHLLLPVVLLAATRWIEYTGLRMVYPFMPEIARGLGVDLAAVASVVALRSGLGLAGPLVGSFAERHSRKAMMILGMGIFGMGFLIVSVSPTFPAFVAALAAIGLSRVVIGPAMHAYLGDNVGYHHRGLAVGATEFGYAGAYLVGMPLIGWMIARGGWTSPFPWLAALSLAGAVGLACALPSQPAHRRQAEPFLQGLQSIARHPSAIACLLTTFLLAAGNENIGVVYGAWMEGGFGLHVAALGAATAVIGLADLGGEGLVAFVTDPLGKKRAVVLGASLNAASSLVLPFLGQTLPGALAGLFAFYLTFEFAIVSLIPIVTEMLPEARGTLLASNMGAHAAGRAVAALAALALFESGLLANGLVTALLDIFALGLLVLFVRFGKETKTSRG